MLDTLQIKLLRNGEFIQLMTDELGFINGIPTVAAAVATPKGVLTGKLAELNALFVTDQASPLSDDLAALDAQRDGLLTGLGMFCKSFTYHPDPSYKEAGETLGRSIEIYGDVVRKNYNAESASISSLVTDWTTKSELIAASNLVNAGDFIAPLGTINSSFMVLYNQRTAAMSITASSDTLKEKRTQTTAAWKDLRAKIEANIVLNDGAGVWGQIKDKLNTLTEQYKQILLTRAGRAAAASGTGSGQPAGPGGSTGGGVVTI